jgi:acyl-CoA synthetase (AMP-forming)/AMP-acid ligase II
MSALLWDQLEFQARLRPHALAVHAPAGPIGFDALLRDVAAQASELLALGVSRLDMVGLAYGPSYRHLLVMLALDRLGIPSMSFASAEAIPQPTVVRDVLGVTAIVGAGEAPADPPCRWIAVAEHERPHAIPADPPRPGAGEAAADELVRVLWSSGTTGGVKGAPIARALQAQRIATRRLARGLGPRTRYLAATPFSSAPGYVLPLATLAAGGAVLLRRPGIDFIALANALGATMTSGPPSLLAELVGAARAQARRLETIELFMVSGANLPAELARDARALLTPNLWIGYGATETDGVANADAALVAADPNAAGYLFPWVEAEAVDPDDRPLPPGQEGMLRLRCPQMIAGYYRDDDATRRNFRDGWFYPGDIGEITGDRRLRITGRVEEIIVRDGVAVSPAPIEEALRGLPGVRDVAVFAWTEAGARPEIAAAFVIDQGADAADILARARTRLGAHAPTRLFALDRLPRNENGKVMRRELVALARQGIKR